MLLHTQGGGAVQKKRYQQPQQRERRTSTTHDDVSDDDVQQAAGEDRRRLHPPAHRPAKPRIIEDGGKTELEDRGRTTSRDAAGFVQRKNDHNIKPTPSPRLETYDSYQKGASVILLVALVAVRPILLIGF